MFGRIGLSANKASLLAHYERWADAPAAARAEATGWGLELRSPLAERWDTVSEFLEAYCRETTPAGVLVVASDPSFAGALGTGLAFTDAPHAEIMLDLQVPPARGDERSAAFWTAMSAAKRAVGAPYEALFANAHLAHAFPYALMTGQAPASIEKYLPSMPLYRRTAEQHLAGLLDILRPQAVACVGRVAYEAVASVSSDRLKIVSELAERGWDRVVLDREYAGGFGAYPSAEFKGFRARLIPLDLADARLAGHARDTLTALARDAWT